MNRRSVVTAIISGIVLAGLPAAVSANPSVPVPLKLAEPAKDDHKHDKDHKHDEHKGEKKELGVKEIAGFKVKVTQVGDVKPGKEAVFVCLIDGKDEPTAIRAWIGAEVPGEGGKEKAEEEKHGEWHAHVEVPEKLPEKSKLWVEVETAAGRKAAAYDYK